MSRLYDLKECVNMVLAGKDVPSLIEVEWKQVRASSFCGIVFQRRDDGFNDL
jgi:hypothetical protein